jgi:hypothetical protein
MSVYLGVQEQGSQIVGVEFETTVFYNPKQGAGSSDSSSE